MYWYYRMPSLGIEANNEKEGEMPKIEKETQTLKACSMSELASAAHHGDVHEMQRLNYTENMLHQPHDGMTLLGWAMSVKDHVAMVNFLLRQGAKVNVKDDNGDTPLHYAARHKSPIYAAILLDSGADNTIKNNQGVTPAELAKEKNRFATAEYILNHAAELKKSPSKILGLEDKYQQLMAENQELRQIQKDLSEKIALVNKEIAKLKLKLQEQPSAEEKPTTPPSPKRFGAMY